MADDDRNTPPRRRDKKSRVTLTLEAPPLRLPTDPAPPIPSRESEPELPIPDAPEDAWSRNRPVSAAPPPSEPPVEVETDEGDALDLVTRRSRRKSSGSIDHSAEMADRYALGDYTEALRIAELILGRSPDHEAALRTAKGARERLEQLYTSRLGALSRVVHPAIDPSQVRWLGLDHRAAFLLSRADGELSVEELVDVSGMPRLEALKTLVELLDLHAIALGT
jgi:hypothetical protein